MRNCLIHELRHNTEQITVILKQRLNALKWQWRKDWSFYYFLIMKFWTWSLTVQIFLFILFNKMSTDKGMIQKQWQKNLKHWLASYCCWVCPNWEIAASIKFWRKVDWIEISFRVLSPRKSFYFCFVLYILTIS